MNNTVVSVLRVANAFVYYGMSVNSTSLGGNKYLNFALVCLVEIPGYTLAWIAMNRLGRRWALCGSLLLCTATCVAAVFVPEGAVFTMGPVCSGRAGRPAGGILLAMPAHSSQSDGRPVRAHNKLLTNRPHVRVITATGEYVKGSSVLTATPCHEKLSANEGMGSMHSEPLHCAYMAVSDQLHFLVALPFDRWLGGP
jgi:hypothetical protein